MEKTKVSVDSRSCTSCKHCGSMLGQGRTITSVCRYDPPRVSAALLQGPEGLVWNATTAWPTVTATDFCSKWEARLN